MHTAPMAGLGLKSAHAETALRAGSSADFFELHAENAMVAGGPLRRQLEQLRERWPLSVHGVGLSLGGARRPDRAHLARLVEVVRRLEPRWVSEHLAWSSHGGRYLADLLPVACDEATLRRVAAHVDELQSALGRQVLIENPSRYLGHAASTMTEAAFLAELVERTGCGLLLDVTNAWVSGCNQQGDAAAFVDALPAAAIGELHLAGFATETEPGDGAPGASLLIDHHGAAVPDEVWALYERVLSRIGPRPTLIERDHDVPPLAVLEAEADRARATMARLGPGDARRVAAARGLATIGPALRPARAWTCASTRGPIDAGATEASRPPAHDERSQADQMQQTFAEALLDPRRPVPAGLFAPAGRIVSRRFDVHRNNTIGALVAVLADTFPVLRLLLGPDCFDAVAAAHVRDEPPGSPVLLDYGSGFAGWLRRFEPLANWAYLGDVAALEWLRHRAAHAADAEALDAAAFARLLAGPLDPASLHGRLHPSVGVLASPHAVVSLWDAHQQADVEAALAAVDPARPEAALVLRDPAGAVWIVPVEPAATVFVEALGQGLDWLQATQRADRWARADAARCTTHDRRPAPAGFDPARLLASLIRHGGLLSFGPGGGDAPCHGVPARADPAEPGHRRSDTPVLPRQAPLETLR